MNNEGNEKYLVNTQNYLISRPKKVFPKNSIAFPKNGGAVFTNKKRVLVTDSVVDLNTGVYHLFLKSNKKTNKENIKTKYRY